MKHVTVVNLIMGVIIIFTAGYVLGLGQNIQNGYSTVTEVLDNRE